MAWAFYNSSGAIVGGFEGAWKFFNSSGEVQSTFTSGGADCGDCDLLTTGGDLDLIPTELIFADGNVIWL